MKNIKNLLPHFGVFIASLIQLTSPAFSNFGDSTVSSVDSNPMITPAGYAFTIWAVITFLAFCYGIYQLIPKRKNAFLHGRIAPKLMAVYLLFAVWLNAASKDLLWATVIIFVAMLVLLIRVFTVIIAHKAALTPIEKIVLCGQIALYTGWSTIAVFANVAAALKFYGFPDTTAFGQAWQALILIASLFNGAYWIRKFDFDLIYAAAILWAFVAVFIGLTQFDDAFVLKAITVLAILIVLFVSLKLDNKFRQRV